MLNALHKYFDHFCFIIALLRIAYC